MKIALHNELPAESQFKQLADSIANSAAEGPLTYEVCSQSRRVIAAYDEDDRLVAIGRLVEGSGSEPQFEFTVLPSYREREIESYMRKLLLLE